MAVRTLRAAAAPRISRPVVAVEADTRKGGFTARFNLSKKSGIRMTAPNGAEYYFSVDTIRSLAGKLSELADAAK